MNSGRKLSFKEHLVEFAVGAFFLSAMLLLGIGTIILSKDSWAFLPWVQQPVEWQASFPQVSGLAKGDRVLVRGVETGKVKQIAIFGSQVRVVFTLKPETDVYKDCKITIEDFSMLGGKVLALDTGTPAAGAASPGVMLQGTPPTALFKHLEHLMVRIEEEKIIENVSGISRDARQMIGDTKEMVADVKAGKGTLGQLITNDSLFTDAKGMVATVDKAGKSVDGAASEIKGMVTDVRGGKGTLGKLMVDDTLFQHADETMKSLATASDEIKGLTLDIRAGKGTLGKLATDESLYNDYREVGRNLEKITADVAQGKGSLGRLLADDGAAYEKMLRIADDIGDITGSLKNSKGTLGLMINDPALYNDARKAVVEVRRTVEDFQETMTWTSFGSLVLGGL